MSAELFLALAGFAAVTLFTPGPNNMMLLASGANFGFRATLGHLFGVALGFALMAFMCGVGLIGIFELFPALETVLKAVSVVFLGWLAWKIAHAAAPADIAADETRLARPIGFWQAAAFQWVNPKAWTMALTAIAAYAPERSLLAVFVVAATFLALGLCSASVWTLLGREARRILSDPRRLTLFNRTMAALLVATLVPVLFA
ncbi:MAG: hypothetical protein CSA74_12280 [Rhodobacterales bacterium]|nr:MAG: hypothetical protein CSA74_12280 [Rhodobacterales bacterium]